MSGFVSGVGPGVGSGVGPGAGLDLALSLGLGLCFGFGLGLGLGLGFGVGFVSDLDLAMGFGLAGTTGVTTASCSSSFFGFCVFCDLWSIFFFKSNRIFLKNLSKYFPS
jgi:hypothetical protein